MLDNAEPAPIIPHSKYSSKNHFEDQINSVANKNESKMVEMAEHHVPTNQPTGQNGDPNNNESEMVEMAEQHVPTNQSDGQMQDAVIIDLNAKLLDRKEPPLSTSCCIYRVSHVIREQNVEAYTPKVVSIGPLHYGNPRLRDWEEQKLEYYRQFIGSQSSAILLELVSFVRKSERRIRACYSETINLSQDEFVKVILVDAIFIIVLFRKFSLKEKDDAILRHPWHMDNIQMDLLLLENQLPFFILEDFFNMSFRRHNEDVRSFLQLTFWFFWPYNTQGLNPSNLDVPIKHFTDLLRNIHFRPATIVKRGKQIFKDARSSKLLYSASELNEAGVKFKAKDGVCLLNLKFSQDVLEIPQISVDDGTEILFPNIIAFEQYHYHDQGYIIDYLSFLDDLINTSKDVDVLIHNDIIVNNLSDSNDVAQLFNGLCKNILVYDDHDYQDICQGLNEFYRDPWNKKKATLRRDYCKTPWQTAASIAAIVLIILTIVQTICSIIQVVHT